MPTLGCSNGSGAAEDIMTVLSATGPSDLFGTNENSARIRYHRLAARIHPDANGGDPDAERAFKRLSELWSEYSKPSCAHGTRRPVEITRGTRYAVFDDDGKVLVVDRRPGTRTGGKASGIDRLAEVIEGYPVYVLTPIGQKAIDQSGVAHMAVSCERHHLLEDGTVMLQSLSGYLPGRLHPADLAWIMKRVIFLVAVMSKEHVWYEGDLMDAMAIVPRTHALFIVNPMVLVDKDDVTIGDQREAMRSFRACMEPIMDSDWKTARMTRFLDGVEVDRHTQSGNLLREFDDLLYELFGEPRFHVMEVI